MAEDDKEVFALPKESSLFMDLLVVNLLPRLKDKLMEEIDRRIVESQPAIHANAVEGLEQFIHNIKIEPDNIEGLDAWVDDAIDEHDRHSGKQRIHVDDIEDLDKAIEDVLNNGTFSTEFSC